MWLDLALEFDGKRSLELELSSYRLVYCAANDNLHALGDTAEATCQVHRVSNDGEVCSSHRADHAMNDRSRSDSHAYGEVLELLDAFRAETDDTERSRASAA